MNVKIILHIHSVVRAFYALLQNDGLLQNK